MLERSWVPFTRTQSAQDMISVSLRHERRRNTVSCAVAETASSGDVLARVSTAILSGNQMLGGALQSRGFTLGDSALFGKSGWFFQPHW
jgi:hypothetical protein